MIIGALYKKTEIILKNRKGILPKEARGRVECIAGGSVAACVRDAAISWYGRTLVAYGNEACGAT